MKRLNLLIDFLQNIPCFKQLSRRGVQKFTFLMKRKKFTRGQTIYSQDQPADSIYIVQKGEFELSRKLYKGSIIFEGEDLHSNKMTHSRQVRRNILAKRLPEICDVPNSHKLSIFGRASMLGEEDVATRANYQCTLKCYS